MTPIEIRKFAVEQAVKAAGVSGIHVTLVLENAKLIENFVRSADAEARDRVVDLDQEWASRKVR